MALPDLAWLKTLIPLEGPLWSWLLFGATAAIALEAVFLLVRSFGAGGTRRFPLAVLLGLVCFWTLSWMWGWHEPYETRWRLLGWTGVALVLVLATVHVVRSGKVVTAFIAACLPLAFVLGLADVTSRQNFEWRLIGADRAEIGAAFGFGDRQARSSLADRRRRSWSDVAKAWRSYAEETKRLDEAIEGADAKRDDGPGEGGTAVPDAVR